MTRSTMILNQHTTENPLEFWTKTSANGTPRAYYWSRTGKSAISLTECELAKAQGTAILVAEPEF